MTNENDDVEAPEYCSLRADNHDRWSFIRTHLEDSHARLLDVGCAEGFFVNAAAELGIQALGIEANEQRYKRAVERFGDHDNADFEYLTLTPDTVHDLPAADVTLCLTVQHHWAGGFGAESATQMLESLAEKTDLLCYEPPGTMFPHKENPIHPDESTSRYREYLVNLFGSAAEIRDVQMFDHVNEGKYAVRRDPLFVVDTETV